MSPQRLRLLLLGFVGLPLGCDSEVCTTEWDTFDMPIPPRDRCNPTPRADDASADAVVDSSLDAGADADPDGAAAVEAPARCATVDAGSLDEWLALPCADACRRLFHSGVEILSCEPPRVEPSGAAYVRCATRAYSCRESRFMMGRPAADFVPSRSPRGSVGDFFAHASEMEAASIPSFLDLARDLAALGLPRALSDDARRFARDERVHARMMRSLARRRGVRPTRRTAPRRAPMSPLELARANVAEGCVGELFAAALATRASLQALDRVERGAFERIAGDEIRHAAFALSLHHALAQLLTTREREIISAAREHAIAELEASLFESDELIAAGVHPSLADQRAITRRLRASELWS